MYSCIAIATVLYSATVIKREREREREIITQWGATLVIQLSEIISRLTQWGATLVIQLRETSNTTKRENEERERERAMRSIISRLTQWGATLVIQLRERELTQWGATLVIQLRESCITRVECHPTVKHGH